MFHYEPKFDPQLYVYSGSAWRKAVAADYLIDSPATFEVVEDGTVLPLREIEGSRQHYGDGIFAGGVCDANFNFLAGLHRSADGRDVNRDCSSSYAVSGDELEERDESVIFGGVIASHFGHMLCDGTTRLWYPATHPDDLRKVVFVMYPWDPSPRYEVLELAGIAREHIEIIEKPTRFAEIVIPGETVHSLGKVGYKREWRDLCERMREKAGSSPYKKVYYTRTQFKNSGCIGEEYFEDFYAANGYEIVAPEQLSFKEQVSLMAGADEVATTTGTLAIQAIFTKPGTTFTTLNRSKAVVATTALALHAAQSNASIVDVFKSFLPEGQAGGGQAYLLAPTSCWDSYVSKSPYLREFDGEYPLESNIYKYVLLWGERYKKPGGYRWIKNEIGPNIAWRINRYLLGREIDISAYPLPNGWQASLDKNAMLEGKLAIAQSEAQSIGLLSLSLEDGGILLSVPLHFPGVSLDSARVEFEISDAFDERVLVVPAVTQSEKLDDGFVAAAKVDRSALGGIASAGRLTRLSGAVSVDLDGYSANLPLVISGELTENLIFDYLENGKRIIGVVPSVDDGGILVIGYLNDYLNDGSIRCDIDNSEWGDQVIHLEGSLRHPLAGLPDATAHLVEKGAEPPVSLLRAQIVSRTPGFLSWRIEFDPVAFYQIRAFDKLLFDFALELDGLFSVCNFGFHRPKGTMAKLRAVQPEFQEFKLKWVEGEQRSIGLKVTSLIPAKPPRIASIDWIGDSLEVSGEFSHPFLLKNPSASMVISAKAPDGATAVNRCETLTMSRGTVSWKAELSPYGLFSMAGKVEGKYELAFLVGDEDDSLTFPFGVRRPSGTLARLKSMHFDEAGTTCEIRKGTADSLSLVLGTCKNEAPFINAIEWAGDDLEITGYLLRSSFQECSDVRMRLVSTTPNGETDRIPCEISVVSNGLLSWKTVVRPFELFDAHEGVEGVYRLKYVIKCSGNRYSFPFGENRPTGTIPALRKSAPKRDGVACIPRKGKSNAIVFKMERKLQPESF